MLNFSYVNCQIVDDVKFTVSHVVEPVERGIARINETFHQISENMKQHEKRKRKAKDDSYLIPMMSWSEEFVDVDHLPEGSFSDSGLTRKKNLRNRNVGASSGNRWSHMASY